MVGRIGGYTLTTHAPASQKIQICYLLSEIVHFHRLQRITALKFFLLYYCPITCCSLLPPNVAQVAAAAKCN